MSSPTLSNPVTVLAVSSSLIDRDSLRAIFAHSHWHLVEAGSCAEALSLLRGQAIPVVIGEAILPDGTWRDLLMHGSALADPPRLIVTSDLADDRLWAEALNLGAYDVLAKPFRAAEVFRTISLAWRQWKDCLTAPKLTRQAALSAAG